MKNLHPRGDGLVTLDVARELLSPYTDPIRTPFFHAMQGWLEFSDAFPELRAPLSNTTRANFINDLTIQFARNQFEYHPEVRQTDEPGFLCLSFKERLLVRFKKFDDKGFPGNVRTIQQEKIAFQEQLDLPGIPPAATWVIAGYTLNAGGTDIRTIQVVCFYADHPVWSIPLYDADSDTPGLFDTDIPPRPEPTEQPQRTAKVRAKNLRTTEGK
jgi:hypothetical protein